MQGNWAYGHARVFLPAGRKGSFARIRAHAARHPLRRFARGEMCQEANTLPACLGFAELLGGRGFSAAALLVFAHERQGDVVFAGQRVCGACSVAGYCVNPTYSRAARAANLLQVKRPTCRAFRAPVIIPSCACAQHIQHDDATQSFPERLKSGGSTWRRPAKPGIRFSGGWARALLLDRMSRNVRNRL